MILVNKNMNEIFKINVEYLSGFINGVISLNGMIRDYNAYSFFIESSDKDDQLGMAIKNIFLPDKHLNILSIKNLENGIYELEQEIYLLLVENVLNINSLLIDCQQVAKKEYLSVIIEKRKGFISRKIMSLVRELIQDEAQDLRFYKLESNCDEVDSKIIFFGIELSKGFLVLQFNEYL